jgi:alpha-L-rhamnosidase
MGEGSELGSLQEKEFVILDMGTNLTGFIGLEVSVLKPAKLFVVFDEILQDNDVNFKRLGTIAALTYDLKPVTRNTQPATFLLESFEPYTFRYAKIIVTEGEVTIDDFYLREYANPDVKIASFESGDEKLNRIFDAGVETFRQNAVDIFMDCPHRERAGWLCDSYFTARVANDLSGNTLIEKNFFENFLLPDSFPHLPKGMLPMCYPADHNDSVFIPNWAMWFVVELEEYLERSQDRQLIDDLQHKVMALLDYFEPFKNEDGLLENLESWIFVEWSAANGFVQDVNYPTNMLFAKTLEIAGKLYEKSELITEAESIRDKIREQSFNGQFFVDNAVRQTKGHPGLDPGPGLSLTSNTTEVCQYFAFYFGIATPESHPELWQKLSTEFGPNRQEKGLYPDVHPANSFVGNYLRLELLSEYGLQQQILEESIDYFDYMAVKTGTLWENISTSASCNHGFASHIVHVLYRDVLGIAEVDSENKVVRFQIPDIELEFCKGQIPIGDSIITFEWQKSGKGIKYKYEIPAGYKLEMINNSGLPIL